MTIFQAIILGLVQGLTEFLPISSSGHLILVETFFGLHIDELKDFDVALHVGTLLAILLYFRKDLFNVKWWPFLAAASVPAAVMGILFEDKIDALFRDPTSVAIFMILVGLLFFIPQRENNKKLDWLRAIAIGCAQATALIPGVSRSGATLFTGMQLGMKREDAARFSFLLGAIAIGGAGLLKARHLETLSVSIPALVAGFLAAFISSLLTVHYLVRFLKKHGLQVFGIYRIIFGVLLLIFYF